MRKQGFMDGCGECEGEVGRLLYHRTGMRRQGIATLLLNRVCRDAVQEGFSWVEAYPANGELDCFLHFHGHLSMYEKNGFVLHKEFKGHCIVRKKIVL